MQIDPITALKPTNAQLAKGINQIHACFEDHKETTKKGLEAAAKAAKDAHTDVASIRLALGLTEGQKKVAGLSTPFRAFVRTVAGTATALGGFILFYRMAVSLAPGAWKFLEAINHAILSGKF